MWAISNGGQLWEMLMAAAVGVGLAVYYDVFRVIRIILRPGAAAVFAQDMVYFGTSAIAAFLCFIAIGGGALRWYLFMGLLAGFTAYYLTLGRLVMAVTQQVVNAIVWAWHWLWTILLWPPRFLWKHLLRPLLKLLRRLEKWIVTKILRILQKILKKPLKSGKQLWYNLHKNIKRQEIHRKME